MEILERRPATPGVETQMTHPRLNLAPLADFTDSPFRIMALEGGADAAYTEMVSAAALAHSHNPTRILLEKLPSEPPPACQIFGANEFDVAHAARQISLLGDRFCEINLNAGCPMVKVTRSGAGAELVKSPDKVHRLMKAMRENTALPITLKTRLGPNPATLTIHELVDAAVSAGAASVIVHARFTSQLHSGPVHLDILEDVVRRSPVPIVGNGSIVDRASASAMANTGVAAIMIGRAALSRPEIFADLKASSATPPNSLVRAQTLFRRHLALVCEFHAHLAKALPSVRLPTLDAFAALKVRTHLFRYFSGLPGAASMRAAFNNVRSLKDLTV